MPHTLRVTLGPRGLAVAVPASLSPDGIAYTEHLSATESGMRALVALLTSDEDLRQAGAPQVNALGTAPAPLSEGVPVRKFTPGGSEKLTLDMLTRQSPAAILSRLGL